LPDLARLEIQALVRIMNELSYYQLLHVEPDVSSRDLKRSYYETARTFHPDGNHDLDPESRESCHRISKVITEAYCVLRDPRKRKAYDAKLESEGGLRMQLAEARAAHAKQDSAKRTGTTPQGKQFLMKAEADMEQENYASAAQNLQMALTFEPNNEVFKELLEEARKKRN
jgi:DnaJ-class molecular chaperone